jgi:superfamily II RNA helicase
MPCTGCPVVERCLASIKDLRAVERKRRVLAAALAELEDQEIRVFRNRAGVLRELGYLDAEWRLTTVGRIAARIRHPRMLVLAEAIRSRILPTDPAALAAATGALGTERIGAPRRRGAFRDRRGRYRWRIDDRARWNEGVSSDPLMGASLHHSTVQQARKTILALRGIVARINKRLSTAALPEDPVEREFDSLAGGPAPAFQRAAVVGAWAAGRPWEEVIARQRIPEGDLQRLIWQAAEILAHLESLPEGALPAAARTAREAMLRTPVL